MGRGRGEERVRVVRVAGRQNESLNKYETHNREYIGKDHGSVFYDVTISLLHS